MTINDPSYPPLLQLGKLRQDQNSNFCIIKKLGTEMGMSLYVITPALGGSIRAKIIYFLHFTTKKQN